MTGALGTRVVRDKKLIKRLSTGVGGFGDDDKERAVDVMEDASIEVWWMRRGWTGRSDGAIPVH